MCIRDRYTRAKELLKEHSEGHNQLAQLLIEREVIFAEDVERIFGKRPWTSRSEEIMAANEQAEAAKQLENKQENSEPAESTEEKPEEKPATDESQPAEGEK